MYTKQTWADGDVLLASKLNHIEDGIEAIQLPEVTALDAGGFLQVVADYENYDTFVPIPQQTVTYSGTKVPVTSDFTGISDYMLIQNECIITITVNGTDYDSFYTNQDWTIFAPYDGISGNCRFQKSSGSWTFWAGQNGTYTVKLTIQQPRVKWGITFDSGSGSTGPTYEV